MWEIEFNERQREIIDLVQKHGPITGEAIAKTFNLSRAALRADLTVLVMAGILDAKPRVGYSYAFPDFIVKDRQDIFHAKVREYQSLPVILEENTSVYDGIVAMFTEDTGTIFITDADGSLTGLISRKDILKQTLGKSELHNIPVKIIMTRSPNLITICPDDSVLEAARRIIAHQIDSLPVVEEKKTASGRTIIHVVGRFTKTNIAQIFLEIGG